MIRLYELQEKLLHLVGWEQHYDTVSDLKIADSLTESESGLYFQQMHPLLTLTNLNCIAPDFKNEYSVTEYDPTYAYKKGAIVKYKDKYYRSLLYNNIGIYPSESAQANLQLSNPKEGWTGLVRRMLTSEDGKKYEQIISLPSSIDLSEIEHTLAWEETNLFSEWLENKTKSSIQKAISRFYNEKILQKTAKSLCEHKTLFDGTGRLSAAIPNRNNLVGFEIVPVRSAGVTTKINKIGLQFTEPGEYTLFLMHSSSSTPIKVIRITKLYRNAMEWFNMQDLYLPYQSELNDAGGSWYLCYFQSGIPEGSKAIRKDYDWSKGPCEGCSRNSFLAWQAWSKYLEIHPFYLNEELVDVVHFNDDFNDDFSKVPVHLWDIENNTYTYDTNYGINLEITVECDLTDFIIEQRYMFADLIAKQLAVDMLREFAYNTNVRTNRHSINASRVDILYELDGDSGSMKRSGLNYELELALKALKLNTSGIDRICLPCNNNGIKYRTV